MQSATTEDTLAKNHAPDREKYTTLHLASKVRKIIIIGECTLDLIFPADINADSLQIKAVPGGRLLNTAILLGDHGKNVTFVGDAARDRTGDFLINTLRRHNVATTSIDRFTDGATATNIRFPESGDAATVCVRDYPTERFDVVWPRIDPDDIVVFGTYFAIDERVRPQMLDLLAHAAERDALIVYLPGFLPQQAPRITRVMPTILENLELAQLTVARPTDLTTIFGGGEDCDAAYHRHIEFYCPTMADVDMESSTLTLYHRQAKIERRLEVSGETLHRAAAAIAGLIESLIELNITRHSLATLSPERTAEIATVAADKASKF